MTIGEAKEGDIVIINERRWRLMIMASGHSIGCREVNGTPGSAGYRESDLHSWFNKQTEISEISWTNGTPSKLRKMEAEIDPMKG